SVDVTFGLFLVPYALAATVALVYNTVEAGLAAAGGVAAGPASGRGQGDRPPASPRLPLARGEVVPLAVGQLGALLAVAGVVFLLTPRFPGLFITALPFTPTVPIGDRLQGSIVNPAYPAGNDEGTQVFNPRGYFGFGPSVDLRLRGRLNEQVVLRVRTAERRNWRGLVFDVYTGTGWRIHDHRVRQHSAAVPPINLTHGQDDIYAYRGRSRRLVQTFYIQQEQPNVAFAVPQVEQIYLPGGRVYVDRYSNVRLPFTLDRGMIYTVVSRPLEATPEQLRQAGVRYPPLILERYLQLPPTLPARVVALARAVTAEAATPYDAVVAVNRYLWREYRYDLTIGPQRRPGDAVDYFLFEERRGYCEQFASAMAVLLRAVGIPARLVTGYTPGTLHPFTGLLEVRNSDAHAWVEVFFPDVGWVEFEPTPSFPDPATLGDPAVPRWGWEGFARYLSARLAAVTPPGWAATVFPSAGRALSRMAVAGVAAAVALLAVRARRGAGPEPADPVLRAYGQMLGLLARRGLRRRAAETPREFAARVAPMVGGPEVQVLTTVVEAALFGPDGRVTDAAALEEMVARVRAALRVGIICRDVDPDSRPLFQGPQPPRMKIR
ncbi:MAG: transglutaminaseTgpA domain-containing protein, partial [Armatimonadota bacterium]|nr:transglutaminaseTgpA domain-containing protein [Armatimonadota bacterium]